MLRDNMKVKGKWSMKMKMTKGKRRKRKRNKSLNKSPESLLELPTLPLDIPSPNSPL